MWFGSLLWPSLFGWAVWRLSGRKEKRGRLTLNLVLALIVLGQIGQAGKQFLGARKFTVLRVQQQTFRDELASTDDPEKRRESINRFMKSTNSELDRLASSGSEEDKAYFRIIGEFARSSQAIAFEWEDAYEAVEDPRVFDFSLLDSDEEFDYQIDTLRRYIEKTKIYRDRFSQPPCLRH